MKHLLLAVMIIVVSISFLQAQAPIELVSIANDPNVNEIDPYLTYFTSDGYFYWNNASGENAFDSPMWLTYVEVDSLNQYRIVAKNLSVGFNHEVHTSQKWILSDTTNLNEKRNPILENFRGQPVAIWEELEDSTYQLYYTYTNDTVWSQPQKICDTNSNQSKAVFLTYDDFYALNPDSLNYLFFIAGDQLLVTSLNTDFTWKAIDTLQSYLQPNTEIVTRLSLDKNVWLLCIEDYFSSWTDIQIYVKEYNSSNWELPELLNFYEEIDDVNINLEQYSNHDDGFILNWLYDGHLYTQEIWRENNNIQTGNMGEIIHHPASAQLKCASNTLSTGGCVLPACPFYFISEKIDSLYTFSLYPNFYEPIFRETSNKCENTILSGIENAHYFAAWEEETDGQLDINLFLFYIPVGNAENTDPELISNFVLNQNYPNPFNNETIINFNLPKAANVELAIFNLLGQKERTLAAGNLIGGEHRVHWDGLDDFGHNVASGIYIYQLNAGSFIQTKKMILMK